MSPEDTFCTKCGADYFLRDGMEPSAHGMCWPCASEYAERLEAALETISITSSKDIERVKRFAKKQIHKPKD